MTTTVFHDTLALVNNWPNLPPLWKCEK